MSDPELLKRISRILSMAELFAETTPSQLQAVATIAELQTHAQGAVVFEENSGSDELYIIGRGQVAILVNPSMVSAETLEPVVIATLRQGDVLGEMSLVDQGLRSATARVAQEETVLVRIPRVKLMALCEADPRLGFTLMQNLAADLALKIRSTGLTLRQYQLQLRDAGLPQ